MYTVECGPAGEKNNLPTFLRLWANLKNLNKKVDFATSERPTKSGEQVQIRVVKSEGVMQKKSNRNGSRGAKKIKSAIYSISGIQ